MGWERSRICLGAFLHLMRWFRRFFNNWFRLTHLASLILSYSPLPDSVFFLPPSYPTAQHMRTRPTETPSFMNMSEMLSATLHSRNAWGIMPMRGYSIFISWCCRRMRWVCHFFFCSSLYPILIRTFLLPTPTYPSPNAVHRRYQIWRNWAIRQSLLFPKLLCSEMDDRSTCSDGDFREAEYQGGRGVDVQL